MISCVLFNLYCSFNDPKITRRLISFFQTPVKPISIRLVVGISPIIEDITRWREEVNFVFSWQEQYHTSKRSEQVRYCSCMPREYKIHIFEITCNFFFFSNHREFKICDATVTKTSFKIESLGLLIFFVLMSACLTSKN